MKPAKPVEIASAVFDNGRRGMPRPGCDCIQCFGYCMIDKDAEQRVHARQPALAEDFLEAQS